MRYTLILFLSTSLFSLVSAQDLTTLPPDNSIQYSTEEVGEKLKDYSVFQMNLDDLSKYRTDQNDQIESLNLRLETGKINTSIELFNSGLIASDYKRRTSSGEPFNGPMPSPMTGYTTDGKLVKLTLNQGFLHGYIQMESTKYYIDPLGKFDKQAAENLFVIYDVNDAEDVKGLCAADAQAPSNSNSGVQQRAMANGGCFEVEYAQASDFDMYEEYGSETAVENQILGVTNDMQTNYDDEFSDELLYSVVETFIVTSSSGDPWTGSNDAGTLLSDFTSWGNSGGFSVSYDVASIWTDRNFNGGTVGIAWINGLCNSNRYNALSDFSSNSESLRVLTSHELGHNYGCFHDSPGSDFIMAPTVTLTNNWSTDSENTINNTIDDSQGGGCLEDCPANIVSGFSADYTSVCEGSNVQFFEEASGQINSYSWSFPGGQPASSSEANPLVTYPSAGTYEVELTVNGSNGSATETKSGYITVGSGGVDVFEVFTFEDGLENWTIEDEGNNGSFELTGVNGTLGDQAVYIDNFNAPSQTYDEFISPTLNFAGRTEVFMQLDYAVVGNSNSNDSLIVYASNDGGDSYQRLYSITEDGTGNYVTASSGGSFVPSDSTDWCINHAGRGDNCLQVDLSSFATYGDVKVKIEQYHESGNNLYIDKIAFRGDCYELLPPDADFVADVTSGCVPVTVEFTDLSNQNPTSWDWEFQGGSPGSSSEQNPTVVYEEAGTYDVYLTVENAAGSDVTQKVGYIEVEDIPDVGFTYSQNGLEVSFVNTSSNAVQYMWDFGDGNTSTEENPTHVYDTPGNYDVSLTASNICGDNVYTEEINIVLTPVAQFSADEIMICEGEQVQFIDESLYADSYEWTFEGGSPATSTAQSPSITYHEEGVYDVTMIVHNSAGSDTSYKDDFIIVQPQPEASFTASANGLVVDFTKNSTDGDEYEWDFGDGNTSTEENPTHVYTSGGSYVVELTVINDCGEDVATQTINLTAVPVADFSSDLTEGCAPLTVDFTSNSPNADSYNWTFEGGNPETSTQENVTVVYEEPGTYDVTLEVENESGSDILVKNDYITVLDVPMVDFTASTNGLTVQFNNQSQNANSYEWDFGDGNTSTEENPEHTYASSGEYDVSLTAINQCGETEQVITIGVGDFPNAQFEATETEGCVPFEVTFENNYDGDVDSYSWTFEGGTPATSSAEQPTVAYNSTGSFDVELIVENGLGADTVLREDYIVVDDVAEAGFSFSMNGLTVDFVEEISGNYSSISWDFGDGNTSTEENPSHTYNDYGSYTVEMIVTNQCGTDTITQPVNLVEPAMASFDVSQTSGCVPLTVTLDNQSTGSNLTYNWILDGGDPPNSQEYEPTVVYNNPGTYDITLIVSNSSGSDTFEMEDAITVFPNPTVDFNFEVFGDTVVFNNLSQHGDSYLWEFGDGSTSMEENPTHIYDDINGNEVTLTVYDMCDTVSKTVLIDNSIPPEAIIGAESQKVCVGSTLEFNDVSEGVVLSREWEFEGGTPATSTEQNPVVTYNETGRFSVTLRVSNSAGMDTVMEVDFVTVIDVPEADFDYELNGNTVEFEQLSTFAEEYRWDFGNGIIQNGRAPTIEYENGGSYNVELVASNKCGSDTISKTISITTSVSEIPESSFKVYPNPFNDRINIEFTDELSGNVVLKLYNHTGKLIKRKEMFTSGNMIQYISIDNVVPGLYILELTNDGKVAYRKLIGQ